MSRAILSAEHDELQRLAAALLACVAEPAVDQARLGAIRWSLTRKLLAHLAKEDALLYPRLKAGPDAHVAAVAARFSNEMGTLAERYRAYVADWPATRIAEQWSVFGAATRAVMALLLQRIENEETKLYVLLGDDVTATTRAA